MINRNRKRRAGLCLVLCLLFASGCARPTEPAPAIKPQAEPQGAVSAQDEDASKGRPLTVTDGLDRVVALPGVPSRIVSLAPKNTEILFAIGAGDQVVGVTTHCNYPSEAQEREKVGGFSAKSLSLEKIV